MVALCILGELTEKRELRSKGRRVCATKSSEFHGSWAPHWQMSYSTAFPICVHVRVGSPQQVNVAKASLLSKHGQSHK